LSAPAGDQPGRRYARVKDVDHLLAGLDDLGVRRERPVVVLVGGAGGMADGDLQLVDQVLRDAVFPVLDRLDAAVVDGGTDSGVMRVVGRARDSCRSEFPLIGVAAEGTVARPEVHGSGAADTAVLEPHHTHIVLVPGHSWGDESPWLAAVADAIAGDSPSVTLVVNGGAITYDDIERSLNGDRPVLVLSGTGRAADAVASVLAGHGANPRAERVATSPLTKVVDVGDTAAIAAALGAALADQNSPSAG
jgi:hypothetical protein